MQNCSVSMHPCLLQLFLLPAHPSAFCYSLEALCLEKLAYSGRVTSRGQHRERSRWFFAYKLGQICSTSNSYYFKKYVQQACGCRGVGEGWIGSLGSADENYYIERMDKQQGPTVEHRELYSTSCDKPQWKRI